MRKWLLLLALACSCTVFADEIVLEDSDDQEEMFSEIILQFSAGDTFVFYLQLNSDIFAIDPNPLKISFVCTKDLYIKQRGRDVFASMDGSTWQDFADFFKLSAAFEAPQLSISLDVFEPVDNQPKIEN